MRFRKSGKVIRALRPAEGDGPPETVLTLQLPKLELSDEDRGKLSSEELQEVTDYVERIRRQRTVEREYAVAHFAETLDNVLEWIELADPAEAEEFAKGLRRPASRLRREVLRIQSEQPGGGEDE